MAVKAKFTKKNGKTFKKVFKSSATRKRAMKGWRSKGGKVVALKAK